MDKDKIEQIKNQLINERNKLLTELNNNLTGIHQSQDKEELADFTDQSSIESNRSLFLKMKERKRNLLIKIETTLDKIKDETFGICEECENPINDKRLTARPVVTLCITCKTEQEKREKMGQY